MVCVGCGEVKLVESKRGGLACVCATHQIISSRLSLTKEGRCGLFWCDQIDSRLLLAKPKKHGKPKLRSRSTPPSNPKDIFQSPHYRTCKCWKDIHLAENMRHYGESRHLPDNVLREQVRAREGKHPKLFVAMPLVSLPPKAQLDPSMNVSHTRTSLQPFLTHNLAWRAHHRT